MNVEVRPKKVVSEDKFDDYKEVHEIVHNDIKKEIESIRDDNKKFKAITIALTIGLLFSTLLNLYFIIFT